MSAPNIYLRCTSHMRVYIMKAKFDESKLAVVGMCTKVLFPILEISSPFLLLNEISNHIPQDSVEPALSI